MARVTIIQVLYNHKRFIKPVFDAIFAQTFTDIEVIAVIAGNEDGGKEFLQENYPQVKIIDPGYNLGFTRGHNMVFKESQSEFFQLVNPDLIMNPDFVEKMMKPFDDPRVGAVSGKLLQYNFDTNTPTNIIDSTGVVIYKTGRARDRGQHEIDSGQFDSQVDLMAVSGAGAMYRKSALEAVKYMRPDGSYEYFDEDFHSYFEDVDLSWRMINAGYKIIFTPEAIAYHGRGAGSSKKGYSNVWQFIKHHQKISSWILKLNYKNHIFLYLKNSPKLYWKFFAREFFMLGYMVIFETKTLTIIPELFRQLPIMLKKRKYIQEHRKITISDMEKLFSVHPTDITK